MFASAPHPYGSADAEIFMARTRNRKKTPEDVAYAVTTGGSGLIGVISVSPQSRGPNLGYWLGETFWGKGIMTEAVGSVIGSFFERSKETAMCSGIIRGNDASLAIQRKFGFEVTGESTIFCVSRGQKVSHVDTLLTRAKYEEMRS